MKKSLITERGPAYLSQAVYNVTGMSSSIKDSRQSTCTIAVVVSLQRLTIAVHCFTEGAVN